MALVDSYLDRTEFATRSIAPDSLHAGEHIDPTGVWTDPSKIARRAKWFEFIESNLKSETSKINARLHKRYITPFSSPVPEIVLGWLAAKVSPLLYLKRGVDPSDQQYVDVVALAASAEEQIREAADAAEGLFELPLRQDTTAQGISRGGPMALIQSSPYDFLENEVEP